MYQTFYGLTDKPFQLNPDPSFYFGSREHRRAMAYLEYGLHQNEGFIVVTGEVGTGKTTLIRSLLGKLDPHQVVAAQLVSTQLDAKTHCDWYVQHLACPQRTLKNLMPCSRWKAFSGRWPRKVGEPF